MVKNGGATAGQWTWRVCLAAWEGGRMPDGWRKAAIVPLNRGKGSNFLFSLRLW